MLEDDLADHQVAGKSCGVLDEDDLDPVELDLVEQEKTSAEKLQTTVGNKRRNYTKGLGREAFTLADGISTNLTTALNDYPALAVRLSCEPLVILAEREAEAQAKRLTPIQRQRLARKLLEGDAAGDGQGVA